jgi:hypothetical protein
MLRRSGNVCSVRVHSDGTETENPCFTSLYVSNLVAVADVAAVAIDGDAKKAAAAGSVTKELVSHWRLDDDAVWRLEEETVVDVDVGVYAEAAESTKAAHKEDWSSVENVMIVWLSTLSK